MGATWYQRAVLSVLAVAACVGCEAAGNGGGVGVWRGPEKPVAYQREDWSYHNAPGVKLTSYNYVLYSTMTHSRVPDRLLQLLEAALVEYRRIAPTVAPSNATGKGPMPAYIFANRGEWMAYTREHTGVAARLYLQITRGGYTVNDYFVSYYTADQDTWSVTAHEGFHQFCARHFKGRLPPFLEEGLATTFEEVQWEPNGASENAVPRLNPKANRIRSQALKSVLEANGGRGAVFELTTLFQLDAGQVVGQSNMRILAFYAQSWAFSRFVQEYADGKYLPGFRQWVQDTVAGTTFDPTGTHRTAQPFWDRHAVQPIVEHYLNTDTATLQREFDDWCHYLTHEEFPKQWVK